ncbi:TPA: opacity family porin [Neisseria lactamica]|uniref:opacity family porin n=1 Tax=Neisseria TaxID=482 RepID=UPI000E0D63B4|nr:MULTISPECIES: opacity family porin [Neisseria]
MKKLLTALTVLALPAAAFAADNQPGVYVQGDAGLASIHADGETFNNFLPRVSVGFDAGDMRIAADYYRVRDKIDDATATLQGAGVAVIKDFNTNSIVKPYVGARLGLNRLTVKDEDGKYSKTKASIGALGGVGFEVAPNVTLDLGYRFNYLGKFDDTRVFANEYTAGVRVKF